MAEPVTAETETLMLLVVDEGAVREHLALTAIRELVDAAHARELVGPLGQTAGMMRHPRGGPELNRRATYVGDAAAVIGGIAFFLDCLEAVEQTQDGRAGLTDGDVGADR